MRKSILLSVVTVLLLFTRGFLTPTHAQTPATDLKPTFYRLVPGTYVNGYPRFTIHYPQDWVERRADAQETFRASAPGPSAHPAFVVAFGPNPRPLDTLAERFASLNRIRATDVRIVSDKPSQLRDGSPAQEVEIQMVVNGAPLHTMSLAARRGDLMVITTVMSRAGRVGEDLKAIPYSVEFQPDRDKPVKVPSHVQEFIDKMWADQVSHDLAKVMSNYSDRFLNSGVKKQEMERYWRQVTDRFTSVRGIVTDFVAEGDRVYLTGFAITNLGTGQITETSIINENGEWKWYGNQRDPLP
jgi:hypothetical protein